MCSSVQVASATSGRSSSSHHSSVLKVPNIILLTTSSIIWDKLVPLWLLTWLRLPSFGMGTRLLSDHWFGLSRVIRSLFAYWRTVSFKSQYFKTSRGTTSGPAALHVLVFFIAGLYSSMVNGLSSIGRFWNICFTFSSFSFAYNSPPSKLLKW